MSQLHVMGSGAAFEIKERVRECAGRGNCGSSRDGSADSWSRRRRLHVHVGGGGLLVPLNKTRH